MAQTDESGLKVRLSDGKRREYGQFRAEFFAWALTQRHAFAAADAADALGVTTWMMRRKLSDYHRVGLVKPEDRASKFRTPVLHQLTERGKDVARHYAGKAHDDDHR